VNRYSRLAPVGYAFHASLYCAECGEHLPAIDPEGNEKHPIAPWELSDIVRECGFICGGCESSVDADGGTVPA